MKWFPDTAYWRVLKPKNETVNDPNNATFKNPRAPTITEEDAKYGPTKHDFDTHIKRPVSTGKQDARYFTTTSFLILTFLGLCSQVIDANTK